MRSSPGWTAHWRKTFHQNARWMLWGSLEVTILHHSFDAIYSGWLQLTVRYIASFAKWFCNSKFRTDWGESKNTAFVAQQNKNNGKKSHSNTRGKGVKWQYCWKRSYTKSKLLTRERDSAKKEAKKKVNRGEKALIAFDGVVGRWKIDHLQRYTKLSSTSLHINKGLPKDNG